VLDDIRELIECESPSADPAAIARSAEVVARLGTRLLGTAPERPGQGHLRWQFGGPSRVLLLGHHDTVWPLGSLPRRPWSVAGGVLRGPGCFDMKAGLVLAMHAIAAQPRRSGITLLITSDEEVGSITSRELIESTARGCEAALVLEGAADGGALKTERKGTSNYRLQVTGRAAHAGLEPERGVNAAVELAHQLLVVNQLGDPELGTTVTPTVLAAGTTTNTVPAFGEFAIDVRARTTAEQERVDKALRALSPVLPGAQLTILGGLNRPPLEAASSAALYERAVRIAGGLGQPPPGQASVGGASDGNFTAGMGVPTLDGLGAVGGGAHADDEHVLAGTLPGRLALLTALIADLIREKTR
jgi:glutamate carboxypeptidase